VELAESDLARARVSESEAEPPFNAANHAVRALEAEIAGLARLMRRSDPSAAPPVLAPKKPIFEWFDRGWLRTQ
jgi:chromosome segregation protein